jgi:hypothetical protein
MAVQTVVVYKSDLLPKIRLRVGDACGDPIPLETALSVLFYMGELGSTPVIDGAPCDIVDADLGLCDYFWTAGQTDAVGEFIGEVVVTFASGKKQTAGQFNVKILESLH